MFENRVPKGKSAPSLPAQSDPEYYHEFVVETPQFQPPGPQRLVVGKGGEMYYTSDHYDTFIPVN